MVKGRTEEKVRPSSGTATNENQLPGACLKKKEARNNDSSSLMGLPGVATDLALYLYRRGGTFKCTKFAD